MAKAKKKAPPATTSTGIPNLCVRVGIDKAPTDTPSDCSAAQADQRLAKTRKFVLGKQYGYTSPSVRAARGDKKGVPKNSQACAQAAKRKSCPVQLVFDSGQPKLRFCGKEPGPGPLLDIVDPVIAQAEANRACDHWRQHGSFEGFFASGTPLGGPKSKRRRKRKLSIG